MIERVICIILFFALIFAYPYGIHKGEQNEKVKSLQAQQALTEYLAEQHKKQLQEQGVVADETKTKLEAAEVALANANALTSKLQYQASKRITGMQTSSTSGDCQAAVNTGLLFADLFRRADKRAGELAGYADRARIAGESCEKSYKILENNQNSID